MIEKKEVRVRMDRDCHDGMGHKGMGRGQWWENPVAVKELGLSEQQTQKIDDLSLNHRKNAIKLQADLKIAELEMRSLMGGDPSDSDVRKKAKAVSQLREKLHETRIEHMLALRKVLTPEQQKKLKDMKPGMGQRRMMMEKGGCDDGPCHD
jgi:Spy/CpxP family protein refolding chaperone